MKQEVKHFRKMLDLWHRFVECPRLPWYVLAPGGECDTDTEDLNAGVRRSSQSDKLRDAITPREVQSGHRL